MTNTLQNFLDAEVDSWTKTTLIKKIEELNESEKEFDELNFNLYNVYFFPKENKVKLEFDMGDEDSSTTLPLDDFYTAIERFETKS